MKNRLFNIFHPPLTQRILYLKISKVNLSLLKIEKSTQVLVPMTGLEPALCKQKQILNLSRLPISPHRQKSIILHK